MYASSMAMSAYPVSLPIFPIIESCEKYVKKIRLGVLETKLNYDLERKGWQPLTHIGFCPNDKSL